MDKLHTSPFASSTLLSPSSNGRTPVLPPTYGWWDALPIVSGPNEQRPVLWTSKGIIFPHPDLPTLMLQPLPPGSRLPAQSLPVPDAVLESVSNFGPPRMFSISPNEQYLFAYFPSVSGLTPGVACIWQCLRLQLNWNVGPGDGIVGCWWLGHEREWTIAALGEAVRLPPLGPDIGRRTPMVLILSENFNLQIVNLPIPKIDGVFQDLHINLLHKSSTSPGIRSLVSYTGLVCTRAAMGLAYNDSSILFAMHSELLPPPTLPATSNSMDIPLSNPMHPSYSPHAWSEDWEVAGPDTMIRLCEVRVKFTCDGWQCTSEPLPPLSQLSGRVSHLLFIPKILSAQHEQTEERTNEQKGARFLVIGTTTFGTFTGPVESTLLVHSLFREEHGNTHTRWVVALGGSCTFQEHDLLAICPASTVGGEQAKLLATHSSNIGRGETPRWNETQVLLLPSLAKDSHYHPLQLKGSGVPLFMAVSRSGTHFAVSGAQNKRKISIHPYPSVRDDTPRSVQTALSRAILQPQVPYDLYEILGSMEFSAQLESLASSAKLVRDQVGGGGPQRWDTEITKIMFHVLKQACTKETDDNRRTFLRSRADFTLNICSLHAIESALLDTKPKGDGGVYDEDSLWPIAGMCSWFIEFFESLLRACDDYQRNRKASSDSPPDIEIKLHVLLHPSSLSSITEIIEQMLRFRKTLENEISDGKPSKVVQEVLADALDESPVDFNAGLTILNNIKEEVLQLPAHELQRSWITHDMSEGLRSALDTFTARLTAPAVVELLPLYVKPTDIYVPDDVTVHLQSQERDIVTKAVLESEDDPLLAPQSFLTCSRCGGRSQIGSFVGGGSSRWRDWERSWGECICGGVWQVT